MTHFDPKALRRALMVAKSIASSVGADTPTMEKGGRIKKAFGGDLGDETQGPDAPAFRRMARRTSPGMQPTNIMKEKGGQWLSGSVEDSLEPLITPSIATTRGAEAPEDAIKNAKEALSRLQQPYSDQAERTASVLTRQLQLATRHKAVNDWIGSTLKKYIQRDMGTEHDPVRALAERGILHYTPSEGARSGGERARERANKYFPEMRRSQLGKSELAKDWESASDYYLQPRKADFFLSVPSYKENNPWFSKLDPNTPVYGLEKLDTGYLGFDHLRDELHTALSDHQGLPRELQLRPESLQRMSVPQAVEHVHKINKWRENNRAESNKKLAFNPATYLHKDYPDSDLAWFEIKASNEASPAIPDVREPRWQVIHTNLPKDDFKSEAEAQKYLDELRQMKERALAEPGIAPHVKSIFGEMTPQINAYNAVVKPGEPAHDEHLRKALKYEGDTMGHCVGNGYHDDVLTGNTRIFSLRNKKTGEPHVTIETSPSRYAPSHDEVISKMRDSNQDIESMSKEEYENAYKKAFEDIEKNPPENIIQIKGKGNKKPVDRYIPYVQDFVKSGDWGDVMELENSELHKIGGEYFTSEQLAPRINRARHFLDTHPSLAAYRNATNSLLSNKTHPGSEYQVRHIDAAKPVANDIPYTWRELSSILNDPEVYGENELGPNILRIETLAKRAGAEGFARGGSIAEVPVKVDPQKAIRRALMVARKARKLGGGNKSDLEKEVPTSYFEVAPGKTWDPAQQESWERLHPQAKQMISNRMIEEFIPKWKKMTGIKGEVASGLGGFGGFTNPNFTFRPHNVEDIPAALNGLGELFRQDAMMGAHHQPFEGSFPSGLVRIKLPKNISEDKIHSIYKTLNDAGLAEGHSTDPENRNMDILSGANEEEAAAAAEKIDKLLAGRYTVHSYPVHIAFPSHGEHYGRSQTPGPERSDPSVQGANDSLQAKASQLQSEAAERLGALLEEAHRQGGGHEAPVDFSSLESLRRIYGNRIAVPTMHSVQAGRAEGTLGVIGAPGVSFMGKQPHEFTPADWGAFGEEHGVPTLGPKDTEKWRSNLQKIKTLSGREVTIPGGIESKEPFSYYDMLHLKSQGINPNDLPPETHQKIHDRMISAMQPSGTPSPIQVANQMMFGMISPNQPLTPNELALQRIMAKGHGDIAALAGMIPYHYGSGVPSRDQLQHFSRAISRQLGLHAGHQGGIGASGSANYADIAEFAQKMHDRPDFFTFDPTTAPGHSPSEKWSNHVAKVINEVRGLSAKTGSLASVWQSPRDAAISAIDRHMATRFQNNVFDNEDDQQAWQKAVLDSFNKGRSRADRVGSFDEMLNASGGRGHFVDAILAHVNNIPSAKTRLRSGQYNPAIPEALRNVNWVSGEPQQMSMIAGPYVRALEQNAREAQAAGQGLFSNQWMLWDRIRNRLEPHEILYPGLEKLPRMSLEQMRQVRNDLSKSGYLAESGEVTPLPSASHAGYFSSGGSAEPEKGAAVDRALQLAANLRRR